MIEIEHTVKLKPLLSARVKTLAVKFEVTRSRLLAACVALSSPKLSRMSQETFYETFGRPQRKRRREATLRREATARLEGVVDRARKLEAKELLKIKPTPPLRQLERLIRRASKARIATLR